MLFLLRHSQAGPRGNYDELSALGVHQAQLLGAYFAQQNISFEAIYRGELQRQQHTANIVSEQLANQTEIITDARWNEFKLGEVYRSIASLLCAESEGFARDFAAMHVRLNEDAYAMDGAIARCDYAVMRAWLENRFPAQDYEPWTEFQARVRTAFAELRQHAADVNIAVFTSATPIAIATGIALELSDEKIIGLAWVMYNSGMTTFKQCEGAFYLHTLNATPHLTDVTLQTQR